MSSGDEPMLSQEGADNAPMISSVQTKVYADLRGAYHVGNLRALLERMDEAQGLHFRQALMRQLVWKMDLASYFGEQSAFRDLLQRWSEHPSHALAEQIRAFIFPANHRLTPLRWGFTVANLIRSINLYGAAAAVRELWRDRRYDPPTGAATGDEIAAQQWQLDAAWAILRGRDLPAFPPQGNQVSLFDSVRERIESGYQGAYLPRHLDALIERMSGDQRRRFHQRVVRQGLDEVQRLTAPGAAGMQPCLDAIRRWLEQPDSERALHIFELAYQGEHEPADGALLMSLASAISADTPALAAEHCRRVLKLSGETWTEMDESALRLQVETAWAILQDDAGPSG